MIALFRRKSIQPRPLVLEEECAAPVLVDQSGTVSPAPGVRVRFFIETLPGGASMKMVLVPAGFFVMGSAPRPGVAQDELPHRHVRVSAFYLSQIQVTQTLWKAAMGTLPPCRGKTPAHPVDRVSWRESIRFCERLAILTGRPYRLPSEAEWEYACRAGSLEDFSFGRMITTEVANYVGRHRFLGGPEGVYRHGPLPPGCFPPNPFGLYDMHGNLDEWCMDSWHDTYSGAPADSSPWISGGCSEKAVRGGSWHDPPALLRSAARLKADPAYGEDFIGVRLALDTVAEEETGA